MKKRESTRGKEINPEVAAVAILVTLLAILGIGWKVWFASPPAPTTSPPLILGPLSPFAPGQTDVGIPLSAHGPLPPGQLEANSPHMHGPLSPSGPGGQYNP